MVDASELVEKDRIANVIHRLFVHTDEKDWAKVRHCLSDRVVFDMTSLSGGEPSTLNPKEITDLWETGLDPIEAVHHQAGNLRIEVRDRNASATCYGIAYHYKKTGSGRDTRTFVGSYDFELTRNDGGEWRITLFRFRLKFTDGNPNLEGDS
jgi:hypothetical protein